MEEPDIKPTIVESTGAVWMRHMNAWVDNDGNIYSSGVEGQNANPGDIISAELFTPEDVREAQSIFRSGRAQQFQTLLGQDPRAGMLGEYGQQYLASALPGASAMYATSQMMPGMIGGQGESAAGAARGYAPGLVGYTGEGEYRRAPSFTQWATEGGKQPTTAGDGAPRPGYRRYTTEDYQTRLGALSPFLVGGQDVQAGEGGGGGYGDYARAGYVDADASGQRAMRQQWGTGLGEGAGAMAARDIDFADAKALIMGSSGLGGVSPANPGAYYAARDLSRRIDAFKAANPEAGGYQLLQDYTARGNQLGAGGGFTQFASVPPPQAVTA